MIKSLLVGLIIFFIGCAYTIFQPQRINHFYGYRTRSSQKNNDTWKEANKYAAKKIILSGISLIIIGCFSYIWLPTISLLIVLISTVLFLSGSVWLTERHLRKTFDELGERRISTTHK